MNANPRWLTYALAIGILLLVAWCSMQTGELPGLDVSYSRFKELVRDGQVEAVTLRGEEAVVQLRDPIAVGPQGTPTTMVKTRVPAFGDQELLPLLEQQGVEVRSRPSGSSGLVALFWLILPWLVLIGIY